VEQPQAITAATAGPPEGTKKGRRRTWSWSGPHAWLWRGLATWLACFLLVDAATVGVSGWASSYRMATSHHRATATVSALLPDDRTGCTYSYVVKGQKLGGSWAPCPRGVHVGSHFLVTYLASDPATSQPGDPSGGELGGALFVLLAPVLLGVVVAFGYRHRQLQSRLPEGKDRERY
jgi:hypothetical protein